MTGVWFEQAFSPMEEPHFLSSLSAAPRAYQTFVGARTVGWPRTRIGREFAAELRRERTA